MRSGTFGNMLVVEKTERNKIPEEMGSREEKVVEKRSAHRSVAYGERVDEIEKREERRVERRGGYRSGTYGERANEGSESSGREGGDELFPARVLALRNKVPSPLASLETFF